jgi:hypothetical protein
MKHTYNIEYTATDEEHDFIANTIDYYDLKYKQYVNPEDYYYYIEELEIGDKLLTILKLSGAEMYIETVDGAVGEQ